MSNWSNIKWKTSSDPNKRGNPNQWKKAAEARLSFKKQIPESSQFPELSNAETLDELKKVYRKLAKEYHPDKEGGDEEIFKQMDNLYRERLIEFDN